MKFLSRLIRNASSELAGLAKDDWLADDPRAMLELLRGRASERKLRLFAVACCRRIEVRRLCWVYSDAGCGERDWEKVLEASEQFADGMISAEEMDPAVKLAARVDQAEAWQSDRTSATATAVAVAVAMGPDAVAAAMNCSQEAAAAQENFRSARAAQAELLREIFIHPSRRIDDHPALAGDTAVRIARAIYDDQTFDRLPELAGALEQDGYTGAEILDHCRRGGRHVRGCWAVDRILGKP